MVTLGNAIAVLIASRQSPHSVEKRLDALVDLMVAADNGRLDRDAIEVLFDSGISRDDRRALVDLLNARIITLEQVEAAVAAAKSHLAKPGSKAS